MKIQLFSASELSSTVRDIGEERNTGWKPSELGVCRPNWHFDSIGNLFQKLWKLETKLGVGTDWESPPTSQWRLLSTTWVKSPRTAHIFFYGSRLNKVVKKQTAKFPTCSSANFHRPVRVDLCSNKPQQCTLTHSVSSSLGKQRLPPVVVVLVVAAVVVCRGTIPHIFLYNMNYALYIDMTIWLWYDDAATLVASEKIMRTSKWAQDIDSCKKCIHVTLVNIVNSKLCHLAWSLEVSFCGTHFIDQPSKPYIPYSHAMSINFC